MKTHKEIVAMLDDLRKYKEELKKVFDSGQITQCAYEVELNCTNREIDCIHAILEM